MTKYKFPYSFELKSNGRIITFPTLQTLFSTETGEEIFLTLLIDSGAETTLLRYSDAEVLGINLKEGRKIIVSGISPTPIWAFRHEIKIRINEIKLKIPVLFTESNETPRVLGREEVFDKFFILFDENAKQTVFILRDFKSQKNLKPILND